ncbi:recombination protein NinB [Paraburkholderia sp. BCC1885]|uniref:recombination protein NinB n=1 Tax=Paraburkholderia sp. BCC1885 TaxID=2562669 RepID=UPI001181D8A3|nr:recombination protein NinB [Paraburkholderia sp. BCC1885]
MSDKQLFRLTHPTARQMASRACINAPDGFVVEIKPATRSIDQNAKLHAMFADVARQSALHGRKLTADQWKVIFISGHAVATGLGADLLPGIEGEFVNIRESSARMGVKRMASLIEYMLAWGADNEIVWSEPVAQGYEQLAEQFA